MSICETSITNPKKQLEFYKELSEQLQQKNKKYKEVIDKALEYIEQHAITVTDGAVTTNKHELLEILKEVE